MKVRASATDSQHLVPSTRPRRDSALLEFFTLLPAPLHPRSSGLLVNLQVQNLWNRRVQVNVPPRPSTSFRLILGASRSLPRASSRTYSSDFEEGTFERSNHARKNILRLPFFSLDSMATSRLPAVIQSNTLWTLPLVGHRSDANRRTGEQASKHSGALDFTFITRPKERFAYAHSLSFLHSHVHGRTDALSLYFYGCLNIPLAKLETIPTDRSRSPRRERPFKLIRFFRLIPRSLALYL